MADSLDHVIKRLDKIQHDQSTFHRLAEQLEAIQSALQTHNQKQCLLDKKLEIVVNFYSLFEKTLSTMAHFDSLLDKKLFDIKKIDSLLDKILLNVTVSGDVLDKKLSHAPVEDNLLDKIQSDIRNVENVFDKKLSDLANVIRQENVAMLQEIKETRNEIMSHLRDTQLTGGGAGSQVSSEVQTTSTQHQSLCGCRDDVKETKDGLETVGHKPITQTILQADSKYKIESQGVINIGQQVKRGVSELEPVLSDIYSIPDLVRGQTRAELVWLDSQINEKLDVIEGSFRENVQHITMEVNKNTAKIEWIVNALREKKVTPQGIDSSVNNQPASCDTMIGVLKNIEELQFSLDDRQKLMTDELVALSLRQDSLKAKIEECSQDVKLCVYKSKREIFAVTEKEAQIVRDRIEGPLPLHGQYLFDFYVDNFKTLVRSERDVHSPPWHINEMRSSMMGMIWFPADGQMEVCFVFSRHPREVGLQPRPAIRLKLKSTVCDIHKQALPSVDIGEKVWTVKEGRITCNFDWGCKLGVLSCEELLQKGYGCREEYRFGALLVRFHVTVC